MAMRTYIIRDVITAYGARLYFRRTHQRPSALVDMGAWCVRVASKVFPILGVLGSCFQFAPVQGIAAYQHRFGIVEFLKAVWTAYFHDIIVKCLYKGY